MSKNTVTVTDPGLEQVVFCGFTSNEQMELDSILKDISKDIGEMAYGPF